MGACGKWGGASSSSLPLVRPPLFFSICEFFSRRKQPNSGSLILGSLSVCEFSGFVTQRGQGSAHCVRRDVVLVRGALENESCKIGPWLRPPHPPHSPLTVSRAGRNSFTSPHLPRCCLVHPFIFCPDHCNHLPGLPTSALGPSVFHVQPEKPLELSPPKTTSLRCSEPS